MGGKAKTSQRTKNNVRPSSSGRSAELLNHAANAEQYFAAGSGAAVLFSSLATSSVEQGLPAEYSVCFKKFTKKDPVTKTKALQELTELVKTGNVTDAEAALPSWSHHYQFLTIDSDRRVREATQVCHGAIVAACGRRVAPQLRRVLPAWLLALNDEHAPACSVAQAHLQNTFPEGKLAEALSFCKAEIIALLSENLTGNADAMVGKRIEDAEERQAQVSRVLASSLYALQLIITKLPAAHDDWLWDSFVSPLLQHNYFWGLMRHQLQPIRAAWYGAVGGIIERFGARISLQVGTKVAKALVAEPERNAGVAAQRWAALLLLMRHVEEWHLWLEKKDLLVARLLDMIENSAWGSARLLSNMLVPLLASLPANLLTKQFYVKFFDAMFTGLSNKNLLNSKSERQTWISNLGECLRYLSTQNYDFVTEVITYVHRTWLERVLNIKESQARTNLIRHSMTNMASLIKYWLNQSQQENEKYDQLTRNFWQNIGSTILTQIDKLSIEQDDIVQAIESHILLLKTLHTSFVNEPKKKMSIQFEDQKIDLSRIDDTSETLDVTCDEQLKERFKHNLNDLVQKTCCGYFDFAHKKLVSQSVCPVLTNLLIEFDSRDLFMALAKHFGADSVYGFYDKVLRPWLAGDTMRCKALVEMVFLVVKYLSEEEQDNMFSSFQQFPPPVVEWCIQLSLSHPHSRLAAVRRWMRGPVVDASVLALCKREEDNKATSLLLMCLAPDDTGEVIVSESSVAKVVQVISDRLESTSGDAQAWSRRAQVAAETVCVLARGAAHAHCAPLLRQLFRYRLRLPHDNKTGATAASSLVRDAWRDALPALPTDRRNELLTNALRDLCDHVFYDIKKLHVNRIEDAASTCTYLFGTTENNKPSVTELVSLTDKLFTQIESKQPETPLEFYALRCDCIHGHIIPAFERNNELCKKISLESEKHPEELSKEDLMISVHRSLFRGYFLRKITQTPDGDVKCNSWCNLLLSESHFKEVFSRFMYDYAVIYTLFEYYAFWLHYEIIYQTKKQMESLLEDILTDFTIETKDAIYSFLTESFAKQGQFYWPFARKLFDIKFNEVTAKINNNNKTPESPNKSLECSRLEQENDIEQNDSENVKDDSKTIFKSNDCLITPAEDNILKSKMKQKDFTENSKQDSEAKLLKSDNKMNIKGYISNKDISTFKPGQSDFKTGTEHKISDQKNTQLPTIEENISQSKLKLCDLPSTLKQSKISELPQNKSDLKPVQSKGESKPEQSSKPIPEQSKPESKPEQTKTESKPEHSKSASVQSKREPTSEHEDAHKFFADASPYVDKVQWAELLGSSSLQELVSNSAYYLNLEAEAKYSPDASRDHKTRFKIMMRSLLSAHMHEPTVIVQLLADSVSVRGACSPDPVVNAHYCTKQHSFMLFERDLTDVPWTQIMSNVAVVEYLSAMVAVEARSMLASHWDFVNISLSSLLDSVGRSVHLWGTTGVCALLRGVTRLLSLVCGFMRELRCALEPPPEHIKTMLPEWDEIFAPAINKHLFTILHAVLRSTDTPVTASSVTTVGCLITATKYMDWNTISKTAALELSMQGVAEAATRALLAMNHHAYKYLAFHTLQLMVKPLVFEDALKLKEWNAEENEGTPRPATCFALFDEAMNHLQDYTEAALANVKLCEGTCEMVPFSDSHCVSLGYMLLAASFLRLCTSARGNLYLVYTEEFRGRMYAEGLMSCTLRLLPSAVAAFAYVRGPALSAAALQLFRDLPALDVNERCSGDTVGALACYVLTETLGGPGAMAARSWCGAAHTSLAPALRRLVPAAVAPVLLQRHLTQLKDNAHKLPDARISIQWSRGEVQCWVELEDHELELTVRFAPEHPLVPPSVSSPPNSPTPDTSWIVLYLTYHNGTLLNALKMWTRAVNSRVQSAAQCYVCYCRMHPSSGRFPNVSCHQCRNKFHSACLNKWFRHSRKTNCPLCRNKF
ncbi:E3 ubiquitin-protein ligase listerin isoform X2 [Maniola jurtina]|uniref:E3 ubiquitin-protein ligase listerin isoform X2 n=1 Tax=Maniola jurtina TaxID=191418 RepID=UPI001E6884C9|nr:E3 ubiquitin-protein ligase listerin isoform X2 [Maniola jurtina]